MRTRARASFSTTPVAAAVRRRRDRQGQVSALRREGLPDRACGVADGARARGGEAGLLSLEARVARCAIAFSVRRVRPARRRCFFPLLAPTRSKSPTAPSILAVIPFGTFAPAHAGPCSAASNRQRGVVHGSVVVVVVVGTRVVVVVVASGTAACSKAPCRAPRSRRRCRPGCGVRPGGRSANRPARAAGNTSRRLQASRHCSA